MESTQTPGIVLEQTPSRGELVVPGETEIELKYSVLERIPDRAIIHEAVTIAKKRGHEGTGSLKLTYRGERKNSYKFFII